MSARDPGAPSLQCTGEPVSWLALERLRLGELPPGQRRAVEQHLAACAACAACLAEIDRPLALPVLPAVTARAPFWWRVRAAWHRAARIRIWAPAALAALLAVFVLARPKPLDDAGTDRTLAGIKGDGVALALVRERDGAIDHDATTFASRDRWKALVTCPSARVVFWDVAVFDGARESFPLAPTAPITCGNRVSLPGAFRLDGDRAVQVCLLLAGDPIDRARVNAPTQGAAACVTLQPER